MLTKSVGISHFRGRLDCAMGTCRTPPRRTKCLISAVETRGLDVTLEFKVPPATRATSRSYAAVCEPDRLNPCPFRTFMKGPHLSHQWSSFVLPSDLSQEHKIGLR